MIADTAKFEQIKGKPEWVFRGGNRALISAKENEVVLAGPAASGKTVAACWKLHVLCMRRPGANCAIIRKTHASIAGTVLRTFMRVSGGKGYTTLGGDSPNKFRYGNGSTIWTYGLDNPDRLLSSEFDLAYFNQAEEASESDWETVATRCTGRAGAVQYPQIMGDCNPGSSQHWIRKRKSLRLLTSTHKDNPVLYDDAGELTPEGRKQMSRLEASLTGVRRKRLLDGIWASVEGAVYDTFDPKVHVQHRDRAEFRTFYLAQDEGYTNPAVILLVGEDNDGRWHILREFYKRGVLQSAVVAVAKEWFVEFKCRLAAVDAAAAGLIADLQANGVWAVGGKGRVVDGIQIIQDRLKVQGDGRPRLTIEPECLESINEFESYQWEPDKPKDVPIKEFDHVPDAARYLADVLAEPTGALTSLDGFKVGGYNDQEPAERVQADRLRQEDF